MIISFFLVTSSEVYTMATQPLWHRRVAKQAVRSASRQEALRTGFISLRVPRIAPLVLNTPAPAYNYPAETDIQSPTSPPPEFDTLEPGPRHHDYTPYVPGGLEYEPLGEPDQEQFDLSADAGEIRNYQSEGLDLMSALLSLDRGLRDISQVLEDAHPISIVELPLSHSCNFACYGLLPPHPDPGPAAPLSRAIHYPPCHSVDCWAVEHVGVPAHHQGPYQDPSIPTALHGFLISALEAHGLRDLFQNDSVPHPDVWNALHRIIDGTAEKVNGPRESATSDWALIENFRGWHCFGHRSVEELYDMRADDEDSEAGAGESEGGSKYFYDLMDADDDDDSVSESESESEVLSETEARNWLQNLPRQALSALE